MITRKQTEINDNRECILKRDGYMCQKCGKPANQVAHCIGKDHSKKHNRNINMVISRWYELFNKRIDKKQADDIINHPLNLKASCADCNSYFNIAYNPVAVDMKLMEIHAALFNEIKFGEYKEVI